MAVDSAISSIANSSSSYSATSKGKTSGSDLDKEAFLNLLKDYEILELARTGITGLSRGSKDVAFF